MGLNKEKVQQVFYDGGWTEDWSWEVAKTASLIHAGLLN